MKFYAIALSQAGLPNYNVTGGQFAEPQTMGWHVSNERGHTVAIANDEKFCRRLNALETFASLAPQITKVVGSAACHGDGMGGECDPKCERCTLLGALKQVSEVIAL